MFSCRLRSEPIRLSVHGELTAVYMTIDAKCEADRRCCQFVQMLVGPVLVLFLRPLSQHSSRKKTERERERNNPAASTRRFLLHLPI
jgi:hypothetical protein